jgi:hypothetical protein
VVRSACAWPGRRCCRECGRRSSNLHANTLEAPVYWEQFAPELGRFDSSVVDTLIQQARSRRVRLLLLWFGT